MPDQTEDRFTDKFANPETDLSPERKAAIEARLAEFGITLPNGVK